MHKHQKTNQKKYILKEKRLVGVFSAGTGISFGKPSVTPLLVHLTGLYQLSDRWAAGMGYGFSFYEELVSPLYGDIRFQLGKTRKFTPFIESAVGYSFAMKKKVNGGLFMNHSIGLRYPLNNQFKLQLSLGYELQKLERLKKQTDNYFHKEFKEKLAHNMLTLKLGLLF